MSTQSTTGVLENINGEIISQNSSPKNISVQGNTIQENASNETPTPIIGLEVVGHGIYLKPHRPYELKGILFERTNKEQKTFCSMDTKRSYLVPDNYEVNGSPPMPANQAINQIVIEKSWEHFDKRLNVDANIAASINVFSMNLHAGQTELLRSEKDAFYAMRISFIPLWALYLPEVTYKGKFDLDIPTPFDHKNRMKYEAFFERYGSHYIKRAWIGGEARLALTITSSSQINETDIRRSINASYMKLASGSVDSRLKKTQENLLYNSECTVFGQGGDRVKLGKLTSFDKKDYDEWVETIPKNPQVIALELAGIWTLISDPEKKAALLNGYKKATTFTPLSAAVKHNGQVYFQRREKYTRYDIASDKTDTPKSVSDLYKQVLEEKPSFKTIDAALDGEKVASLDKEEGKKVYFFKGDEYLRFVFRKKVKVDEVEQKTFTEKGVDEGYPKPITEGWKGVTFSRIDAAFNAGNFAYFFMGNQYIRYNLAKDEADEGYPQLIRERWVGMIFDKLDAIVRLDDKVYFFRHDEYIRYDMVEYRADPGYPKAIVGSYVEDWKFLDSDD